MTTPPGPGSPAPLAHRELLVDQQCPRRVAVAFARYRLTRPSVVVLTAFEIALVVAFLVIAEYILAAVFIVLVLLITASALATVPRMERTLRARGYRPGTTITVDYFDDRFAVTTSIAHATHHYRDVRAIDERNGIVTIRTRESNLIVLLPTELVPAEVRPSMVRSAH